MSYKKRSKYIDFDTEIIFQGSPKKVRNVANAEASNDVVNLGQLNDALDAIIPVKIGEIDFNDLNAQASPMGMDIEFIGAKPAGKYLVASFIKILEAPVSYSGCNLYFGGAFIASVPAGKLDVVDEIVASQYGPVNSSIEENIIAHLIILPQNQQDWSSGRLAVYAMLKDIPTLE